MRWRAFMAFVGTCLGALVVGVAAIAYDTSAQTAALEGGRRHLAAGQILTWMAVAAIVGFFAGSIFGGNRRR